MTKPPPPSESANVVTSPSNPVPLAVGPLPGYLKSFGIFDLVLSALRLVVTIPSALAIGVQMAKSSTSLPITAKLGPAVDLLLGITGITAGCLLLARSKVAISIGWIAVFLTAVSLPFHMLSLLSFVAESYGSPGLEGFPAGIQPGGVLGGVATLLLRIVALGIYIGLLKEFTKWLHGKI